MEQTDKVQKNKEEMKDEIKNRISLALKDPILQQGFEIICKENAELQETVIKMNNEITETLSNLIKAKEIIHKVCYEFGVYHNGYRCKDHERESVCDSWEMMSDEVRKELLEDD